jgi:hypothetical protein
MADKPILFSAPMVRALLAGNKTQTRRLGAQKHGIGDRLWVREAWRCHAEYDAIAPRDLPHGIDLQFVADSPLLPWDSRYRQAMHMPRWASRLTLTAADVRVQRLQDITDDDAMAEGVTPYAEGWATEGLHWGPTAAQAYRWLWAGISGDQWDENPWVAAYTFTVARGNIDQIGGV